MTSASFSRDSVTVDPPTAATSTCLFTGDPLPPDTRVEHTIQRALGGRFHSRVVSSSRFNEASSDPFDSQLISRYQPIFNRLKPLLASEHGTAGLSVTIPGDRNRYELAPGGELRLLGRRVDARDEKGRPISFSAEDRNTVIAFAESLGLRSSDYIVIDDMATREEHVVRSAASLTPSMELAVLKGALLTFDHVLQDDPCRFTRNRWLDGLRQEIGRAIIDDRQPPLDLLERVVHGIAYEDLEEIRTIRAAYGPPRSEFEHVLIAAGDPLPGTLDIVWLVADTDPFTFRVSRTWTGKKFAIMAGCGVLRGETSFGPVDIPGGFSLGPRCLRRTMMTLPATQSAMRSTIEAVARELSSHRLEALRRAQNLIEHRCAELVRSGISIFARLPEPNQPGSNTVADGLVRRLRRLFVDRLASPGADEHFMKVVKTHVDFLEPDERVKTIAADDAIADHVAWPRWIDAHRAIIADLAPSLGFPGHFFSDSIHIDEIVV